LLGWGNKKIDGQGYASFEGGAAGGGAKAAGGGPPFLGKLDDPLGNR